MGGTRSLPAQYLISSSNGSGSYLQGTRTGQRERLDQSLSFTMRGASQASLLLHLITSLNTVIWQPMYCQTVSIN